MDKLIIGTALFLLTILAFFGLAIWLIFFNPTGNKGLNTFILCLLVAFPVIYFLFARKVIKYLYMVISYAIMAFITFVVALIAWNPNHIVSDHPGDFTFLMTILAGISTIFGLTKTNTMSTTTGIISSSALVLFYIITMFLKTNPLDIVSNNRGVVVLILSFALVLGTLFALKTFNVISFGNLKMTQLLKYSLYTIGILTCLLALIYIIFYCVQHLNTESDLILLFVNIFILIVFVAFVVKLFGIDKKLKEKPDPDPSWFGLIKKLVLYIPCALIDFMEYLKNQYKITPKIIWQLLIIEILLILSRFLLPYLYEKAVNRKGVLLIREPQNINNEVFLKNFEDLNYYKSSNADSDSTKDEMQTYHYCISSWIYINSFAPNTNSSYSKDTSILNIGNKPNIQFNVTKNELIIRMKVSSSKEKIILKKRDLLKYQKWNHLVINYNGGTLDVFLNNELIHTESGIIPYKQYDIVNYGTDNGLYGGICNTKYFNESLDRSEINWLYNSVKNKDPPFL